MSKFANGGYKFDHIARKITITHAFHKKAAIKGSNEFKELLNLRKNHPDYELCFAPTYRKTSARSHMTAAKIVKFIRMQPDSKQLMEEYNAVRYPKDRTVAAPFSVVTSWFFKKFPNYGNLTRFDEYGNLIA